MSLSQAQGVDMSLWKVEEIEGFLSTNIWVSWLTPRQMGFTIIQGWGEGRALQTGQGVVVYSKAQSWRLCIAPLPRGWVREHGSFFENLQREIVASQTEWLDFICLISIPLCASRIGQETTSPSFLLPSVFWRLQMVMRTLGHWNSSAFLFHLRESGAGLWTRVRIKGQWAGHIQLVEN